MRSRVSASTYRVQPTCVYDLERNRVRDLHAATTPADNGNVPDEPRVSRDRDNASGTCWPGVNSARRKAHYAESKETARAQPFSASRRNDGPQGRKWPRVARSLFFRESRRNEQSIRCDVCLDASSSRCVGASHHRHHCPCRDARTSSGIQAYVGTTRVQQSPFMPIPLPYEIQSESQSPSAIQRGQVKIPTLAVASRASPFSFLSSRGAREQRSLILETNQSNESRRSADISAERDRERATLRIQRNHPRRAT
jgi:hypothetical protein